MEIPQSWMTILQSVVDVQATFPHRAPCWNFTYAMCMNCVAQAIECLQNVLAIKYVSCAAAQSTFYKSHVSGKHQTFCTVLTHIHMLLVSS